MKYIEHVNKLIMDKTASTPKLVLYGQNIAAGSHISGFTKNIKTGPGGLVINSTNSESTLAGLGFGMMLNGVSSIFFMKQLDFLLLGIDQLVHSYNFVRRKKPTASYTIAAVNSDLGWHGLQSSFNNFGDICSIARIPGFNITNRVDAEEIINTHLVSPGFRIICVSQRLFGKEILDLPASHISKDKTVFKYKEADSTLQSNSGQASSRQGAKATIVCFNLSLPYGLELHNKLTKKGISASLFSVNAVTPVSWDEIVKDAAKTKNLVVLDDSKSENTSADNFLVAALQKHKLDCTIVVRRDMKDASWLFPNLDELQVNYDEIAKELTQ